LHRTLGLLKKGTYVKHSILFLIAGLSCSTLIAAPSAILQPLSSLFPIKISGYIKNESYWDTRQVIGFREDQDLLYPAKKIPTPNCEDINARGKYDMVAIQTRLRGEIFGPEIKNAKTMGVIEVDFFGRDEISNIIRMRHAHFFLTWQRTQILAGQAYHPLYVIGCDPRTLSFNTGIPIETFSRNPQFRITWSPTPSVNLIFCASTELDNTTDGPIGFSSTYLRNSAMPMLDFQIQGRMGDHLVGTGVDYKRIRPRLETTTGFKAHETLNSAIFIAYAHLKWETLNMRTKFIWSQNGTNMDMTGGYAVHSIQPITDQRTYVNLNSVSVWNDSEFTRSKTVVPGWFIGLIKNVGTSKTILPDVVNNEGVVTERRVFGLGTDLNYVFRFSPRIQWNINNFMFGIEVEHTRAGYGTITNHGTVTDVVPVANTRLLVTLFYYL
jgi:hypothetical protein